ncbi:hypothetical protein [Vibrio phage phiKT1028]|nr:hypothetical protein [Vibrio phage phiKT1028]
MDHSTLLDKPLNVYINVHNQWGYPEDAFTVVMEHLVDYLVAGKVTPDECMDGLHHLVDYFLADDYNPKYHTELSDYQIMTDIENRFFELMESSKSLLRELFIDYPELRTMYLHNVQDARIVTMSSEWALLEVTGLPAVARLL